MERCITIRSPVEKDDIRNAFFEKKGFKGLSFEIKNGF